MKPLAAVVSSQVIFLNLFFAGVTFGQTPPSTPPDSIPAVALTGEWNGEATDASGPGKMVLNVFGINGNLIDATVEFSDDKGTFKLVGAFGGTLDNEKIRFDSLFAKGTPVKPAGLLKRGQVLACDMHVKGTLSLTKASELEGQYEMSTCKTSINDGRIHLTRVNTTAARRVTSEPRASSPSRQVDLRVGDPAPDFAFIDGQGSTYRLADYKGKAIVIVWFSPTVMYQHSVIYQRSQCVGLRDARQYLEPLNAVYFMVSLNTPRENTEFVNQWCQGANFPILSDSKGEAAAAYGVAKTEGGIDPSAVYGAGAGIVPRGAFAFASTTYIGPDGKILYMEEMNEVSQHLRGYGRDVAIKLQQLGVKTVAELSASPAKPKTVELGQTPEQVEAILGKPETIAKLGQKTIYSYRNLKVIFTDGKVTDVQ